LGWTHYRSLMRISDEKVLGFTWRRRIIELYESDVI
jgi:hypothetical protein